MLYQNALEHLALERQRERRREAEAERLALQCRSHRQRRRHALEAALELLRCAGRAAPA